ncbi:MAG: SUMF1/EgtB/PvdO family nonheme iron enzyme [Symploca sp. SIO3C6]|nr:SUMF1/EgtB/PvdO family nonheme iron enzyme [Symploca sp. SIO3C6]
MMIEQLITILGSELEFTATEVADLLWLTLERHKRINTATLQTIPFQEAKTQKFPQPPMEQSMETAPTSVEQFSPEIKSSTVGVYAATQANTSPTLEGDYLPLSVPDARSLREPLDFIRTLKPLLKKVASSTEQVMDELATVDWIAQTDLWMPRLQPALEPWLELALVIDESKSMILWRHAVKELQQLLKHYGMFQDVRVWGMGRDGQEQVYLRSQTRFYSPKELIDPQNRRLIIVVSDVTDDLWRDAQLLSILQGWTASNPVVILQMLPAWMWSRTALRVATPAQFRSSGFGILNPQLKVEVNRLARRRNLAQGINIPVITLEPERAKAWSQMLAGQGNAQTTGYVLRQDLLAVSTASKSAETLTAQERVSNFTLNASPLAQRLAGLLAAAPMITMPVVRLIQDSMLDQSQQIQVAEVFLGGLLKPIGEITPETDPEQVQYEFIEGVRGELLKSIPVPDSEKVLDQVSRYLARKLGITLKDFVAWLQNPSAIKDEVLVKNKALGLDEALVEDKAVESMVKPFARVTQEILRQLGYEFAAKKRDFFISYNGADKAWAEWIAWILEEAGYSVVIQAWDFRPGDNFVEEIQRAAAESEGTIALLSQNYLDTKYTHSEWQAAFVQDPQSKKWRLIPIRVGKCKLEGILRTLMYIDLVNLSEQKAQNAVLEALKDRSKPDSKPLFPGGRKKFQQDSKPVFPGSSETAKQTSKENLSNAPRTKRSLLPEELPRKTDKFDLTFLERTNVIEELNQFIFETVKVNRKGEIINRETKTAQYFTEDLGNDITLDMVYIPDGTFLMGTEDEEIDRLCEKYNWDNFRRERPQHQVTVQPFFMGKYPITQGQWRAVAKMTNLKVNRNLAPEPSRFRFKKDPDRGKTRWDRPVEKVSWHDAVEFCGRLSQLTGKEYRLPTEAEWEYACRAVIYKQLPVTSDGSENLSYPPFHFGETLTDKLSNYDASFIYAEESTGKSQGETTPVGSFPANAFGLYDMHGNVYEWCEDDYHESYENVPTDGRARQSEDIRTTKILRGGSWYLQPVFCRCAYRYVNFPDVSYYYIGLRVVCTAPRNL